MRQIEEWTAQLAELAIFGANVQPGQLVAVTSYIGKEELTRALTRAAYERGAKYVDVLYFDQWLKRERIQHAADDTLDYVPPTISLDPPMMREARFNNVSNATECSWEFDPVGDDAVNDKQAVSQIAHLSKSWHHASISFGVT